MSDASNRDVILERVRKLFARTTERGATEAEAKTAMRMAEKLMEEHGLSEMEVIEVVGEAAIAKFTKGDVTDQRADVPSWDRWIQGCIIPVATITNCRGYIHNNRDGSKSGSFVGCKTDPYVAVELFKWISGYVHLAAKAWVKNLRATGFPVGINSVEARSFKDGFISGLHTQANDMKAEAAGRSLSLPAGQSTALVVVQGAQVQEAKKAATNEWMRENIRLGRARASRSRTHSAAGFNAGQVAGKSVNLNRSTLT